MFLPRYQACNQKFLHDILNDRKKAFYRCNVPHLNIPLWNELSIEKTWVMALMLPDFEDHMPKDWLEKPSRRERGFFFGILCALNKQFVLDLIEDCRRQRKQGAVNRLNVPVPLTIAPAWAERLLRVPFVSGKYS